MALNSPDGFERAIAELQSKLNECEVTVHKKQHGTSPLVIMAVTLPIIIFFLLYLLSPSFVTSVTPDQSDSASIEAVEQRDPKKVFLWTLGTTLLLWGGLYVYAQLSGIL